MRLRLRVRSVRKLNRRVYYKLANSRNARYRSAETLPLRYLDVLVRVFSALYVYDAISSLKLFNWIINQPYCSAKFRLY